MLGDIDETIRGSAPIWQKAAAGTFLFPLIIFAAYFFPGSDRIRGGVLFDPLRVRAALVSIPLGAIAGLILAVKDVISRRLDTGTPVHPIPALYFGGGRRSALAWFVSTIAAVFAATMLWVSIGSLFARV